MTVDECIVAVCIGVLLGRGLYFIVSCIGYIFMAVRKIISKSSNKEKRIEELEKRNAYLEDENSKLLSCIHKNKVFDKEC